MADDPPEPCPSPKEISPSSVVKPPSKNLGERCTLEEVSWLGYCYYTWVAPFFYKAYELKKGRDKKEIDGTYVFQSPSDMKPEQLADAFVAAFTAGGLRGALLTVMHGSVLKATLAQAVSSSLLVIIPLLTDRLLRSIKSQNWNMQWILGLAAAMVIALLLKSVLENLNIFLTFLGANRFQLGLIGAIQRKALRLSAASRQKFGGGVGVNIIGVDPLRMFNVLGYLPFVIVCPLHVMLAFVVLSVYVGWSVLAGVLAIILFFPFQYLIVKFTSRYRKQLNAISDERLRLTQEVLQGIRVLKYFAWEPVFQARIETLRRSELSRVRRLLFLQAISSGLVFWLPIFGGSAIVALHAWRLGQAELDGSLIYTILIMMNYLGTPIFMIPVFSSAVVSAKAAARRLQEFFEASEAACHLVDSDKSHDEHVRLDAAEFVWETLPPSELGRRKKKKGTEKCTVSTTHGGNGPYARLEPISLAIQRSSFVVIVGEVGAGKSSLLSGLIGDMKLDAGQAQIFRDPQAKSQLAYCPQQAWIMSGTVKDNILFGRPFDASLYARAIDESCMRRDLAQLPQGEDTSIGEGGAGLSGGQKQRLSLARALYGQPALLLLDDPLAAVDPAVARRLLHDCILRSDGLLAGSTRILVTHQVGLLRELAGEHVDMLLVMKGCKMTYQGPFALDRVGRMAVHEEVSQDEECGDEPPTLKVHVATEEVDESLASTPLPVTVTEPKKNPLPFASGHNKFWIYFSTAGIVWSLIVGILLAGTEVVKIWRDLYLNRVTDGATGSLMSSLALYTGLGLAQGMIGCLTGIVYGCIVSFRAGQSVHSAALQSLMSTSTAFFDQIQLGALLERFGSDLMSVDSILPEKALQVLAVVGAIISSLVMLTVGQMLSHSQHGSSSFSWAALFVLMATILPLGLYITACWYLFTGGWSPIQCIIGRAASRVTGVFTESLSGLATLRAFQATSMFSKHSAKRIDDLGRSVLLALGMRRWVSTRIDVASSGLVMLTLGLCLWLNLGPKLSGLLMLYSLNTAYLLEWCIKQFAEVESNLNAFDRIAALDSALEPEENADQKHVELPESWPSRGKVVIDDLVVRYRPDLPPTLKGLSLAFEPGQKIAIVGRTGAGKSSLIAALYRMANRPDSGRILIDGVDIAGVPLPRLRQRLSIVMQDPVLFSGTLRSNLDPTSEHPDADLWRVLEATRMQGDIAAHPLKLDMLVEEGGSNFSIGQRQLLCLARALLRRQAPLLLIDEATANVDFETDSRIQEALRCHLQANPGCTLITVAHRISTVMDYDRVAVLGNGKLLEFGAPQELLAKASGHFRQMAEKAGVKF